MPGSYDYWDYFESSRPIKVEGGIKTRSEHGAIGSTWWSKRWISVLESFNMGARLTRCRSYARQGQVLTIDVHPGQVKAKVQGSRPRPYNVEIHLKPLSDQDWDKVTDAMADQAIFAAKLLAGEMPTNIEEAFSVVQLSLFPTAARELETDCSCPDWANPCKHIAAVYYLLAERFDEDPFLIFKLRGRTKEQIIEILRHKRAASLPAESASPTASTEAMSPAETTPLTEDLSTFWQLRGDLSSFTVRPGVPQIDKAILKRLGEAPFTVGKQNVTSLLAKAYEEVESAALHKASEGDNTEEPDII